MRHLLLLPLVLASLVACGDGSGAPPTGSTSARAAASTRPSAAAASASATPPQVAASSAAPSATPTAPKAAGDCVPARFREAPLEGAWIDGGNVVFCAKLGDGAAPPLERACFGIDLATGAYRAKPKDLVSPAPPAKPTAGKFDASSTGGASTFALEGGLRDPHKATVSLVDAKSGTKKSAPLEYDEHVVFDGWIGDAVVLRTWVEEGPGCGRYLYSPMKTWPIVMSLTEDVHLGSCYNTEHLVFDTPSKKKALIDGDGGDLVLVDPTTLQIQRVDTRREVNEPGGFVALQPKPGEVVLVYGQSITGDFVRFDLAKEAIAAQGTPAICPDGAQPSADPK